MIGFATAAQSSAGKPARHIPYPETGIGDQPRSGEVCLLLQQVIHATQGQIDQMHHAQGQLAIGTLQVVRALVGRGRSRLEDFVDLRQGVFGTQLFASTA